MFAPASRVKSDPAERLPRLLQFLGPDPTNPILIHHAAETCVALMLAGRHAEALPTLKKIHDAHPHPHPTLASNLALAQLESGDPQAARITLEPFVAGELEARHAAAWVSTLHALGELEQAVLFARQHEERFACDARFLGASALAYFDVRLHDDAQASCRRALDINPHSADALLTRGSLALAGGQPAAAVADLSLAAQLRKNNARCLAALDRARLALSLTTR